MNEEWRLVPGMEDRFAISNTGKCKSLAHKDWRNRGYPEKMLKLHLDRKGYVRYNLLYHGVRKGHRAHRLVALAFIPNPLNLPQVNHKDNVKTNNNVDNLEWIDNSGNQLHAVKIGSKRKAHLSPMFKGDVEVIDPAGNIVDILRGPADMKAKGYGHGHVGECIAGKRKTHKGMTFIRKTKQTNES